MKITSTHLTDLTNASAAALSPEFRINQLFHSVLERRSTETLANLGTKAPYLSVFDGTAHLEFKGNKLEFSVLPSGYHQIKSFIHAFSSIAICSSDLELDAVTETLCNLTSEVLEHMTEEIGTKIRALLSDLSNVTLSDITPIKMREIGCVLLEASILIGSKQEALLEKAWNTLVEPFCLGCLPELIVTVAGSRSAESAEVVSSYFRAKLGEEIGAGASRERQVIYCHSPKERNDMKLIAANRLVGRLLSYTLFKDSWQLQRDILSGA